MSDAITNITYSNNGKLYAGMTKESIRADIDAMIFKSDKERNKAYNKKLNSLITQTV